MKVSLKNACENTEHFWNQNICLHCEIHPFFFVDFSLEVKYILLI